MSIKVQDTEPMQTAAQFVGTRSQKKVVLWKD
jgi:hypothetical protein